MEALYRDAEIKKIAAYFYWRYPGLSPLMTWEDLWSDTIMRFIGEVRAGRGPKTNCYAYIRNTCRNICEEYRRKDHRISLTLEVLAKYLTVPAHQVSREKLENLLEQIGGQCRILLWLHYFSEPPVKDHTDLAVELNSGGYDVKPGSIASLLARCKRKLKDLLRGDSSSLFED